MTSIPPARWAQLQVVLGVLHKASREADLVRVSDTAQHILDQLDLFVEVSSGSGITHVPETPVTGDPRANRILEALAKAPPDVLHNVLGILYRLKSAGPWMSITRPASGVDLAADFVPVSLPVPTSGSTRFTVYHWFRVHSSDQTIVAKVGPSGWWYQETHHFAHGLVQAMLEVDEAMSADGWTIVPGYSAQY